MKKLLFVPVMLILGACGTEVVYVTTTDAPEKETTTTAVAETTTTTESMSFRPPSSNYQEVPNYYDPENYDAFLWESVNEFWWLFTTDQLLAMGLLVCEEFDRGQTLDQVTESLIGAMSNTSTLYLSEGLAAVTAGALTFLCPEHGWWLDTI